VRHARRSAPEPAAAAARPARAAAGPRLFLPAAAIALLAVALYLPGLRNGFAYDAVMLVQEDARVHTLARPASLLASPYWPMGEETLALYRPLVTLSFAADWALWGGRPWGFHLTDALAHAGASVLVFLLLAGLASTPAALAGAALFAAHPVHTEAVSSIVGRADVLATAFTLASLLAWRRLPPRSAALAFVAPALFFLALGAKESAIMLPALLVLLDAAEDRLGRGRAKGWLRERALPLAGLAAVALGYLAARVAVLGGMAPESVNPIAAAIAPGATRLRSVLQVWPEIARLLVFPRVLLADYGPRVIVPATSWTTGAVGGALILIGALGGGARALLRGRGRAGLALLWAPVALLPVSNLIVPIGVLLAERTLYVAVFALALGVAVAVDSLRAHPWRLRAALAACAVVCVLFGARTVVRLPAWESTDVVFRTLLRDRPDSYRATWHHARMAWRDGDIPGARDWYRHTLELWPYALPVYLEAGMFATETGQEREARAFAERGLEQWPEEPLLLRRLAVACLNLADTAAARDAMRRGLEVAPDDPLLLMMRDEIGGFRPR
jgi:tetratricopeptide (TPR) repeat protein